MSLGRVGVLILLAAGMGAQSLSAEPAETDSYDLWQAVADKLTVRGELLTIYTANEPVKSWPNPNNSIKAITRWTSDSEARLKIGYRDREKGIKLHLEPWLQYEVTRHGVGTDRDRTHREEAFRIGRYLASWHDVLPRTTVSLQRTVASWGSGFMLSPSNPFPTTSSIDNPLSEQAGGDFWRVSASATDAVGLLFYHNYAAGAVDNTENEPFQEAWAAILNYTGFSYSGGLVLANREDDGLMAGAYGQWTLGEAMVTWADIGVRERGRAYSPHADPTSAIGGTFINDADYAPEILVGVSYTTQEDTSFYLEYLHYGAGWDPDEQDLARSIQRSAYRHLATAPAAALTQLGNAANSVVDYYGQHMIGLTVSKSVGAVDLEVNNVIDLIDGSGRLFGSATYSIGPAKASLSGFTSYGKKGAAFRQNLESEVTAALLWRF